MCTKIGCVALLAGTMGVAAGAPAEGENDASVAGKRGLSPIIPRLKDTTRRNDDGTYQILTAEHIFHDYQFSTDNKVALPP